MYWEGTSCYFSFKRVVVVVVVVAVAVVVVVAVVAAAAAAAVVVVVVVAVMILIIMPTRESWGLFLCRRCCPEDGRLCDRVVFQWNS